MKQVIGRKDYWDFPELELQDVPVKIDTGAWSSSLHCSNYEVNGDYLEFEIGDHQNYFFPKTRYRTKKFEKRQITSSNGKSETRYAITTPVLVLGRTFESVFTLSDRSTMQFPVLIGRMALKDFLVDSTLKYVSFKSKFKE